MGLLVINERADGKPFVFPGDNRRNKILPNGAMAYISDSEWSEVPISMRGQGGIRIVSDSLTEEDDVDRTLLDYYDVFGSVELRYLGLAPQGSDTADAVWTIKQFSHSEPLPGDVRIADIQVLRDVAWDDRGTLPWS